MVTNEISVDQHTCRLIYSNRIVSKVKYTLIEQSLNCYSLQKYRMYRAKFHTTRNIIIQLEWLYILTENTYTYTGPLDPIVISLLK